MDQLQPGIAARNGNPKIAVCLNWDDGAGTRTRTTDPLITNEMLYQLSYTGICCSRVISRFAHRKPAASIAASGCGDQRYLLRTRIRTSTLSCSVPVGSAGISAIAISSLGISTSSPVSTK